MVRAAGIALALVAAAGLALPAIAQEQPATATGQTADLQVVGATPILTIDTEAAFGTSLFGVQLQHDYQKAAEALVAENSKIEADLAEEEQELTDLRATLDPVAFRARADAFDEKVQRMRAAQDAKAREVQAMNDTGEVQFLEALTPILADIARDRGAVVVFERQQVLLSAESIDITREAISRLNEQLGAERDGAGDGADDGAGNGAGDAPAPAQE